VKTLRYYDREGLLKPAYTDRWNNYRYYLPHQMNDLILIREYRSAGLSIEDIKKIMSGVDPGELLLPMRSELDDRISNIDRIMERIRTNGYRCEIKTLKRCIVAYRHGTIPKYSDLTGFVFEFAKLCHESNPDVKCTEDDYCFVTYTKLEYQEKDIELTYAQAVDRFGKETDEIGFKELEEVTAVCLAHRGSYSRLGDAYAFIIQEIESKGYKICGDARECYIDGCWNKESEDEWLTEIQIPVEL
jgi:DNA-binding transcriptional MerR regulator